MSIVSDCRSIVKARSRALATGFTLLELMVVLVVLAIVGSMVTLSISAASGHALESAAERLSSTLEEARWQAIATGRRIAWEAPQTNPPAGKTSAEARWYEQTQDGVWQFRIAPLTTPLFDNIAVSIVQPRSTNDVPARLVLGPEPVGMTACVLLTQDGSTVAVVSDGVAPFSVQRDDHCRIGRS